MIRHYVVTALKNLLKNRLFSLINIGGLSIGLAASMLIALYVQDESAYDKHWTNAAHLYRINTSVDPGSGLRRGPGSSAAALPALQLAFPDSIVRGSRLMDLERELEFGDLRLSVAVATVDAEFIDMFDFQVLAGDLRAALASPGGIALNQEFANRIFGAEAALDKVLTLSINGVRRDFRVGAVYTLPPGNTVLELPALVLFDEAQLGPQITTNWRAQILRSYVQLAPGVDVASLEAALPAFIDRNVPATAFDGAVPSQRYRLDLQNIRELHLDSPFDASRAGGNRTVVLAFSAIAVLVLLIGCINFTVLSTARAMQRAKEVSVRKTVGASRRQLIGQHLGESFLVVLPAVLMALMLVDLLLPVFEAIVGKALAVSWTEPRTWGALLLLFLSVGIAGGLYPAFVLSRPRPGAALEGTGGREAVGAARLRNILAVFQFSIAIVLMAATTLIYAQIEFASSRDPGFDKENLLVIDGMLLRGEVSVRKEVLKQAVEALPAVVATTLSVHQPTQQSGMANNFLPFTLVGEEGSMHQLATVTIDHDFLSTYRISLQAGRDYARERDQPSGLIQIVPTAATTDESNVIINASAARELGFASPGQALGARLSSSSPFTQRAETLTVIGVAEDTHFFSLNAVPRAEVYLLSPTVADVLTIRYRGNEQDLLADITRIWREVMGDAELTFGFVDQNMAGEFAQARMEAKIVVSFATLAILIACLGLFGSAAFNVERRTREIGIRKVMGAQVREIVALLLWQFTRPVLLANLLAWPVALWVMLNWLQRFPYQLEAWLLLPICVLAGLVALFIAWMTVGGMAAKAASAKPVLALRYE